MSINSTFVCLSGLDYSDNLDNYEDLTDDEDYDDVRQNIRYCGFDQNFLDKRAPKQLPLITRFKTVKHITPEVRAVCMQFNYEIHALKS